jgi:putative ABC transport system permease protein
LFLDLGALALLVGGVGIANVMVISVLERRPSIGLRRASAPAGATSLSGSLSRRCSSLSWAVWCGRPLLGLAATAIYARARIGR